MPHELRHLFRGGIINDPSINVYVRSTVLTIHSATLRKTITQSVDYYPSVNLHGESITLEEPYSLLAHHLDDIKSIKASQDVNTDQEAIEHIDLLLGFLSDAVYKSFIIEEKERHNKGNCTFRMLWLLFRPGDTIYHGRSGKFSAHVIKSVKTDGAILSENQRELRPYELSIWNLDFNGRFVGRSAAVVIIPPFFGERPITSLQAFPSEFKDKFDGGELRKHLIQNGRRWFKLLGGQQVLYQGETQGLSRREVSPAVSASRSTIF